MSAPRPPRAARRRSVIAATLVAMMLLVGGCAGTPRIAHGTLADAKTRVVALVKATSVAIGARAPQLTIPPADELPCKKRFLGYSVGDTGAHQAEVPVVVLLTGPGDGASTLGRIESYWQSRGYTIDRRGMSDRHFPKLRAHLANGDLVVATGYVGAPEVNLYAVSECVR